MASVWTAQSVEMRGMSSPHIAQVRPNSSDLVVCDPMVRRYCVSRRRMALFISSRSGLPPTIRSTNSSNRARVRAAPVAPVPAFIRIPLATSTCSPSNSFAVLALP